MTDRYMLDEYLDVKINRWWRKAYMDDAYLKHV